MTEAELRFHRIRDLRMQIQDNSASTVISRETHAGLQLVRHYQLIEDLQYCERLLKVELKVASD